MKKEDYNFYPKLKPRLNDLKNIFMVIFIFKTCNIKQQVIARESSVKQKFSLERV